MLVSSCVRSIKTTTLVVFGIVLAVSGGKQATAQSNAQASKGQKIACVGGKAGGYDCSESDLLAVMSPEELGSTETCGPAGKLRMCELNDLWGWTDEETGAEFVLVGMEDGTAFVDITSPTSPRYLGRLPHNGAGPSIWRDIKTYSHYAYIVADSQGGIGIQVFDLRELIEYEDDPKFFTSVYEYPTDRTSLTSAHNIVINEDTGFAYVVGAKGTTNCGKGLHMVSLADPAAPQFAGCFAAGGTGRAGTGYTHDAQCVVYHGPDTDHQGSEICMGANETYVVIADVTDKSAPIEISRSTYPDSRYIHQGWLTEDHKYYIQNDELDERNDINIAFTRTLIWDIIDLDDPILVKEYFAPNQSIDHNLYVKGNFVYQSNYIDGLRILDISDILNPVEVAHFDTHPDDLSVFDGTWSNYPFFPSGTVAVNSSIDGLFLLDPTVQGTSVDTEEQVTPVEFVVMEAFPNPFTDNLTIRVGVPITQQLEIGIYDVLGREVKSVYTGLVSAGGEHQMSADVGDLPSGQYFYRVIGEDFSVSKPITRVK